MGRFLGPEASEVAVTTGQNLIAEGRLQEGRRIVLGQLQKRFGTLSEASRRVVDAGSLADLEVWAERFVSARTLEEVLGPPNQ